MKPLQIPHVFKHTWRKFIKWFNRPLADELQVFRKEYETLVKRYEALLRQISDYMKAHSFVLEGNQLQETEDAWTRLKEIDSFTLQTIRGNLEQITQDCDHLLARGTSNPVDFKYQQEVLSLHLTQLKELRKYSDQIESTLKAFEKRLMVVEEALSQQYLSN